MSDDATKIGCDEARSLAFEAEAVDDHRGLDDERRAALERHLDTCSSCRTYRQHLGGMLDGARSAEPADWGTRGDDELFEAVVDGLDGEAPAGGTDESSDVGGGWTSAGGRARWGAAGLAAGVVLTVVGLAVWRTVAPSGGADRTPSVATDRSDEEEKRGDEAEAPAREPEQADWASVERSTIDRDDLEIFASKGAAWEFDKGGDEGPTIRLESGRLLVEYVPESSRSLRVVADGTTVRVTGTVFYVAREGEETSTGVAEGRVEVERDGADETVTLESGDRVVGDGDVGSLPEADREAIGSRIDLEAHRRKLEERSESRRPARQDEPSTSAPERSGAKDRGEETGDETAAEETSAEEESSRHGEGAESGVAANRGSGASDEAASDPGERPPRKAADDSDDDADLAARARSAMEAGDYERAAERFERLLERLPPDHPDASTAHLDVARIYLHQLDRPERAAEHLRTFVRRWPDDVAADSARRELCRLADRRGWDEGLCEEPSDSAK